MATQYIWFIKDEKVGVCQLASNVMTTPSSTIGTLRLHIEHRPTPFTTTLTETNDFSDDYEEAPLAYVLEKIAVRKQDWESARYWRGVWKELIKDGRIAKNRAKDGTGFDVIVHDHFGD